MHAISHGVNESQVHVFAVCPADSPRILAKREAVWNLHMLVKMEKAGESYSTRDNCMIWWTMDAWYA